MNMRLLATPTSGNDGSSYSSTKEGYQYQEFWNVQATSHFATRLREALVFTCTIQSNYRDQYTTGCTHIPNIPGAECT